MTETTNKKNLTEKAKDYYQDKKMRSRYVVIGVLVVLIGIQLIGTQKNQSPVVQEPSDVLDYNQINFAGELVPFGDKYFFNQEKLDREIAITQLNTAQFVMIHKREPQYFPYIEKELAKAGIPDDFKYLAVAESALRNVAYSSAGAAGIWQFMPATAQRYGLQVDDDIDERLNLEKSTKAAIAYLQDLYEIFGNWTLVAAAYNRGENGLQRDMDRQQMDNYYDLRLNDETARYIFRIIANKLIMEHRYEYFSSNVLGTQYTIPATKMIAAKSISNIAERAVEQGCSYAEVRQLNPRIVGNYLPEGKRQIKIFKK